MEKAGTDFLDARHAASDFPSDAGLFSLDFIRMKVL